MIFKPEVNLELQPEMAKVLPFIDLAHHDCELHRDAVCSSAKDGTHMERSLHYQGLAVDVRSKDLSDAATHSLAAAIRKRLNGSENTNRPYQVVVETAPPHIHVEYQPL